MSQHDASSSRLVFVSIKGEKSKRKVAVPIHDGMAWQGFIDIVRLKLKLSGVGDMYLASTGEAVGSLDQLQDIDEIHVVEGDQREQFMEDGDTRVRSDEYNGAGPSGVDVDSSYESKYVKKQSDMARTMKRMMPALFGRTEQTLPLTRKDQVALSPIEQVKRRMKKRNKRSIVDPRTVLAVFALLSCAATLVFVYLRATKNLSELHRGSIAM
mmetsp:Transcript_11720/g.23489  ORF Transcript_11720/g.23489 Transcript_11720/m.23489 type:complete len:212 (-) Transcript_11720:1099-1734(-)